MNQYTHRNIRPDDHVKNTVMDKFPYTAPTSLFRSQVQRDPALQQTLNTKRGTGESASPIMVWGVSRWCSAYNVVND